MANKKIELKHKVCDYTCMWSGISDMYAALSGEDVPGYVFFAMSGLGGFMYAKQDAGLRRGVGWGDGRPKQMFPKVHSIIGFEYECHDGISFEEAMRIAKSELDAGRPALLGCLDMYYLAYYPKLYHRFHIPIHYVLMTGYDDEQGIAYLLDCGRPGPEAMDYATLAQALDVQKSDTGDRNGVFTIRFDSPARPLEDIARECFAQKASDVLRPGTGFEGIKGMRLLAKEIDGWKRELTAAEYVEALRWLTFTTGVVPQYPERLFGAPKDAIPHHAQRELIAGVLEELGARYGISKWQRAAKLLEQSSQRIQRVTDIAVERILKKGDMTGELPSLIEEMAKLEEEAYSLIGEGAAQ